MFIEKRRYPRVSQILPIKLSHAEYDIVTETKNISGNGVYCAIDKRIPSMTKLKIILLVPLKRNNKKVLKKINCHGVVIRQENKEDSAQHTYHTGIYFNEIKESDRKIILSYIDTFLKRVS